MKKLFLLSTFCGSALFAGAQHLDVGIHGGFGNTWMFNNNVSDQGPNLDQVVTFAPVFGIHAGYNFSSLLALKVEANYLMVNQKYKGVEDDPVSGSYSFKAEDKTSYISIPVLVQLCSTNGFYFEIGPQFSFLTGGKENYTETPSAGNDYSGRNVKTSYKSVLVAGAFGVGGNIRLTDFLYLNAGLRFSYGFTDATKQYSSESDLLDAAQTGTVSGGDAAAHIKQDGSFGYKSTHAATGHIILGLSYRLKTGHPKKPAVKEYNNAK